jgi:hypothetical protein
MPQELAKPRSRMQPYDPEELMALRGGQSKPAFARLWKGSVVTIDRAESTGRLSQRTHKAYTRYARRHEKKIPTANSA